MSVRRFRFALAVAFVLLLSACATVKAPDALTGRLALKVDAHGGEPSRSMSASFELRGDARQGELSLTTPLGTTLARARWQPGEAWLAANGGESRYGDLTSLAEAAFGEAIPLDALFDWLHGRPWAGSGSRPLQGQPGFEQLGWTIDLVRLGEGWVVASRAAPPVVTLRAKLDPAS